MKRFFIISGLATLSLIAVSGCSSQNPSSAVTITATATMTQAAPAIPQPQPQPQQGSRDTSAYIDFISSNAPSLLVASNSDLIDLGTSMCDAWDSGLTLDQTVALGVASGVTGDELAALVVGSALYLCPWNADSIQRQANSSNF